MHFSNSAHYHAGKAARAAGKPCICTDARLLPMSRQDWYDGWNFQDACMRAAPTQTELDDMADFLQGLREALKQA